MPTGQKQQLFDGKTVENKGKLILTEISHRCKNIFKSIDSLNGLYSYNITTRSKLISKL